MWDILPDSAMDSIKIFPFLLVTYILLEYLEHRTANRANNFVGKAGRFAPVAGAVLGVVPQCGFSAAASNLYAGRVITVGTLVAIFLSTSDEMLPIMISEHISVRTIGCVLVSKVVIAIAAGMVTDFMVRGLIHEDADGNRISHLCKHEHCHCEKGIFRSALKHSLHILFFIFFINLVLSSVIYRIGEERLAAFAARGRIISIFLTALVGLIPNCAASVMITELYLGNIISAGGLMSGLLSGSGVGLLVLFRMNRNLKENLMIMAVIYAVGVVSGLIFEMAGISFPIS